MAMSNEELAMAVQAGDRGKLLELWQQVRRMAMKQANKWVKYHSGGVELEDLEQAAFIALIRAASGFDPAAGCKFTTLYWRILMTEFEAATGRRGEKQQRDPLHAAVSLDMQVGEDEGSCTLGELQEDPTAEQVFEGVEYRTDMDRLHTILMNAVNTLPPHQRGAVLAKYFGGEPVSSQAANLSLAMRALRRPALAGPLRAYL